MEPIDMFIHISDKDAFNMEDFSTVTSLIQSVDFLTVLSWSTGNIRKLIRLMYTEFVWII